MTACIALHAEVVKPPPAPAAGGPAGFPPPQRLSGSGRPATLEPSPSDSKLRVVLTGGSVHQVGLGWSGVEGATGGGRERGGKREGGEEGESLGLVGFHIAHSTCKHTWEPACWCTLCRSSATCLPSPS